MKIVDAIVEEPGTIALKDANGVTCGGGSPTEGIQACMCGTPAGLDVLLGRGPSEVRARRFWNQFATRCSSHPNLSAISFLDSADGHALILYASRRPWRTAGGMAQRARFCGDSGVSSTAAVAASVVVVAMGFSLEGR